MNISLLGVGIDAKVTKINLPKQAKRRLGEMGLTEGVKITVIRRAPFNDPIEIYLRSFYLAIRKKDAKNILVEQI